MSWRVARRRIPQKQWPSVAPVLFDDQIEFVAALDETFNRTQHFTLCYKREYRNPRQFSRPKGSHQWVAEPRIRIIEDEPPMGTPPQRGRPSPVAPRAGMQPPGQPQLHGPQVGLGAVSPTLDWNESDGCQCVKMCVLECPYNGKIIVTKVDGICICD